jgi:cell division initiation protein
MRLSPIDIVNRTFQRALFGGVNVEEVGEFQSEVAAAMEALVTENAQLRESSQQLTQQVNKYARIEDSLQSALLMAQRAAEDARASARREAELTVQEADRRARAMMDETHAQLRQVEEEISRLRRERDRFEAEFGALLQGYMNWLHAPISPEATAGSLPPAVAAN